MPVDIYYTVAGDTWDMISYKVYGDAAQMSILMQANRQHIGTARFDADVAIICPDVALAVSADLPPWKQVQG